MIGRSRNRSRWYLAGGALLALLAVCWEHAALSARPRGRLVVFAAASLTEAFTELGERFMTEHPGSTIVFNFAGSPKLTNQIAQGAPADVFAPADGRWMKELSDADLVERPVVFAHNRLAVVVAARQIESAARIKSLSDLALPGVKLVLAAEAVPVGQYARQALIKMSAHPSFGPRFAERVLANAVSFEEDAKAVLAKVRLGEADAGIVYFSDVAALGTPPDTLRAERRADFPARPSIRVIHIPEVYNVTTAYPIATVRHSHQRELATAFIQYALSPAGQAVLASHHLTAVRPLVGGGAP